MTHRSSRSSLTSHSSAAGSASCLSFCFFFFCVSCDDPFPLGCPFRLAASDSEPAAGMVLIDEGLFEWPAALNVDPGAAAGIEGGLDCCAALAKSDQGVAVCGAEPYWLCTCGRFWGWVCWPKTCAQAGCILPGVDALREGGVEATGRAVGGWTSSGSCTDGARLPGREGVSALDVSSWKTSWSTGSESCSGSSSKSSVPPESTPPCSCR